MSPTSQDHRHVREDDNADNIKVIREIPLWGILTVLGVVAVQAVAMYITQIDQGKTLVRFEKEQQANSIQLTDVKNAIQSQSINNLKVQYELDTIKARLIVLESAKK